MKRSQRRGRQGRGGGRKTLPTPEQKHDHFSVEGWGLVPPHRQLSCLLTGTSVLAEWRVSFVQAFNGKNAAVSHCGCLMPCPSSGELVEAADRQEFQTVKILNFSIFDNSRILQFILDIFAKFSEFSEMCPF